MDPLVASVLRGDKLAVPALAILVALVIFVSVLYFTQKETSRDKEEAAGGTAFFEENGHTVRRSTRARKPVASSDYVEAIAKTPKAKSAAPAGTPEKTTPRALRKPRAVSTADATPETSKDLPSPSGDDRTLASPVRKRGPGRPRKNTLPEAPPSPLPATSPVTSPPRRRGRPARV